MVKENRLYVGKMDIYYTPNQYNSNEGRHLFALVVASCQGKAVEICDKFLYSKYPKLPHRIKDMAEVTEGSDMPLEERIKLCNSVISKVRRTGLRVLRETEVSQNL